MATEHAGVVLTYPSGMSKISKLTLAWIAISTVWVVGCTAMMSATMPAPDIDIVIIRSSEPARTATQRMWMEYREVKNFHLAKWTVVGFLPPLFLLGTGMLFVSTIATRANKQAR